MLQHIEQVMLEEKYSKKESRNIIIADITRSDKSFMAKYLDLTAAIVEFLNGNYYESKNIRLRKFKVNEPRKIASEIIIAVMPLEEKGTIQQIATQVMNNLDMGDNDDVFENIRTVAEVINAGSGLGIYTTHIASGEDCMSVSCNYGLEESTHILLKQLMYLPPMVVKPRKLNNNKSSGYMTIDSESLILGKRNHHNLPINLDVLNILNGTAFSIDPRILDMKEVSKKPLDTEEKKSAFRLMVIASKRVYAEMIDRGNKLYFTHKIDKRQRVYCQGFHCNYQGNSYRKSILSLHHKELITEEIV